MKDFISTFVFQSMVDYRELLLSAIAYKMERNDKTRGRVIRAMRKWLGDGESGVLDGDIDRACRTMLKSAYTEMTSGRVAIMASECDIFVDLAKLCRDRTWRRRATYIEYPVYQEARDWIGGKNGNTTESVS